MRSALPAAATEAVDQTAKPVPTCTVWRQLIRQFGLPRLPEQIIAHRDQLPSIGSGDQHLAQIAVSKSGCTLPDSRQVSHSGSSMRLAFRTLQQEQLVAPPTRPD
jgi:hypothetical protein